MLEIDQEGRDQEKYPDYTKPKQIVGEIRIDAQQYAGKHGGDPSLPLAIDKVPDSERTGDDAHDKTIHANRLARVAASCVLCSRCSGGFTRQGSNCCDVSRRVELKLQPFRPPCAKVRPWVGAQRRLKRTGQT